MYHQCRHYQTVVRFSGSIRHQGMRIAGWFEGTTLPWIQFETAVYWRRFQEWAIGADHCDLVQVREWMVIDRKQKRVSSRNR